jgi:hypothetical protein
VSPAAPGANRGITLWGAPTTGKTTFLAALNVALVLADGPWSVQGVDKADADALTNLTIRLNEDHEFPDATTAIAEYHWELVGFLPRTVKQGRLRRAQTVQERVTIPLDLADAAGGSAHPVLAGPTRWDALLDKLVSSQGILFLFDPVREFHSSDAFVHTIGVVNELKRRMRDSVLPNGRLPHYVAVCIAKFDEIKILQTAQELNLVFYDADHRGCPRVHDSDALEFFMHLCEVSDSDQASIVPRLLAQTFDPGRLRYFVTSAIGFYVDKASGLFDPDDYQNHIPANGKQPTRIRGAVDPINVVEPVLWLSQSLASEEDAGT